MPTRPPRLRFGDTIGIVAPGSPPADSKLIDHGIAALEKFGFKIKPAANLRKRNGFLAGSDRERATDLMRMFTDKKVNAIFTLRGGYGTARILPLLDYQVIRANPKILVGYSDITSLHCALLVHAGLISFHGPLSTEFSHDRLPAFTVDHLLRTIMDTRPPGSICDGYDKKHIRVLRGGVATGPLIGGNLSVLCTTIGTRYQPSFRGKILYLEDIGEPPYRFDRMLTHLLNVGLLQQVAGIAIGTNFGCEDPRAKTMREFRQTVDDVLKERLTPLKIPVVTGLPFGHVRYNATLPVGARAKLDAKNGDLIVAQSAVT